MKAWGLIIAIVLTCTACVTSSAGWPADWPGGAYDARPLPDRVDSDRADSGALVIAGSFEQGRQPDGNTVVLEGQGGLIVFDTGRHAAHTQKIVDYARSRNAPVVAIFNSHWHLDHVSGNPMLRDLWPKAEVYSSDAALTEALGSFLARGAESNRQAIESGKLDPGQLEDAKSDLAAFEARDRLHPTKPLETRTVLTIAGQRIEAYVARGASAGDIWIYDPAAKLVMTGDLITLPAPFLDTACPSAWSAALEEILSQPFERAVPGHGREMNRADVMLYRDAFNALIACAKGSANPAACADAWTTSVASLQTGAETDGRAARGYSRYYVESVLRKNGVRSDCPA